MLIAAVAAVAAVFAIPSTSAVACSATCPHLEVPPGTKVLQWAASGYEHWYVSENGVKKDVPQQYTPSYTREELKKGEPPYKYPPEPPFLSGLVPQTIYYQVWVENRPEDKSNVVQIEWP